MNQALKAALYLPLAVATLADAQIFTTVHNFAAGASYTNADGSQVAAPLLLARDGSLYGTTSAGGANGTGTIFKYDSLNGFKVVHTFGANPYETNADGAYPFDTLVQTGDGNFYGTTAGGGAYGYGTVFQMAPGGAIHLLHSFNYSDGENPYASLAPLNNSNFFGATLLGGANDNGSIFRVNTNGAFQSLHDFAFSQLNAASVFTNYDGSRTYGLMLASDGYLYGTASEGGTNGNGTVYRCNPTNGAFNVLHTFSALTNFTNYDGATPYAGLTLFSNGIFWGTSAYGGTNESGTLFQINTGGVFSVVHAFNLYSDGQAPSSPLAKGRDGNFYGTTVGFAYGGGTLFQITSNGVLVVLHVFSPLGSDGSDGADPYGLSLGGDGFFYGTTQNNGTETNGTIYRLIYPGLAIANLATNKILISWPTNQTGFTLLVNTNLASTNWVAATPSPATLNDQFVVTNSTTAPRSFYRLVK